MAKRGLYLTKEKIQRMLDEGRGKGEGENYKPWLGVLDVPSIGFSTTILGHTTNRIHHFLSNLELEYFYILDWNTRVIDIREQFPLIQLENGSIEEVKEIADELGIEYSKRYRKDEIHVMTTDFLITERLENGEEILKARTIKYAEDLQKPRTLEKLEIERVYWKRRDVEWKIVTRENVDRNYVKNIKNFRAYYNLAHYGLLEYLKQVQDQLIKLYVNGEQDLESICEAIDNKLLLQRGAALSILKFLIYNKYWTINMNKKIKEPNDYEIKNIIEMEGDL